MSKECMESCDELNDSDELKGDEFSESDCNVGKYDDLSILIDRITATFQCLLFYSFS